MKEGREAAIGLRVARRPLTDEELDLALGEPTPSVTPDDFYQRLTDIDHEISSAAESLRRLERHVLAIGVVAMFFFFDRLGVFVAIKEWWQS